MLRDPREVAEEIDDLDEYSAVAEVIRADRRAVIEEAKRAFWEWIDDLCKPENANIKGAARAELELCGTGLDATLDAMLEEE